MLKEERFQLILDKLTNERKVLSSELSQAFGVSEDTIRRDLNELSESGLIQKVHGGALPKSPNPFAYQDRVEFALEDKLALASKSLSLFENGQLIILDGGTTNLQVARMLPPTLKATVVTNDLPIALALVSHPLIEVLVLGGRLFKNSQVTVGHEAIETLKGLRADICLTGICSIHSIAGVTTPDYEEAQLKKAMIAASAKVVALATSAKLETAEHYAVCACSRLSTLITDNKADASVLTAFQRLGIEIR